MIAAISLVIASGGLHAVWSLFAKRSGSPMIFLWLLQWIGAATFLPWALWAWSHHPISQTGWLLLLATTALHGVYVILLSWTYVLGDLSQVYPLMRGTSPLVVPVLATLVLGEHLTVLGWMGVGGIVLGIALLGRRPARRASTDQTPRRHAPWFALGVGLCIAAYTTVDKLTLHYVPAVTLNDATNIGNLLTLAWPVLHTRAVAAEWAQHWRSIALGGLISPTGYLLFLLALQRAPVAQIAPMREVGIVIGTILGITVLNEPQGWRRLSAATLVTCGIIVLGLWG